MKFSRVFSLLGFVLSAGMLVAAAPPAVSSPGVGDIAARCASGDGCNSGKDVLSLVANLQADVRNTLSLLDTCSATGASPTSLFVKLAALVEECNSAVAAVHVDTTGVYNDFKAQVSDITAKIILDVSTGCSKFQNVKVDGFVYADLCAKIDLALKGLCVTLDGLLKGCLKLISAICLAKSFLLSVVNFKLCLSLFANLGLAL